MSRKLGQTGFYTLTTSIFLAIAVQSCQKMDIPEAIDLTDADLEMHKIEAVSSTGTSSSSSGMLAYYDFNSGIGDWYEKSIENSWSATISSKPVRAGKAALKFELRTTDSRLGFRAELGQKPSYEKEGWYGFSNYFPADFVKDPLGETIAQFHSHPDQNKGEAWRSPVMALFIEKDHFFLDMRSDPNPVTRGELKVTRLDLGPVEKEKWNDWVIHAKWAWDNTGVLEIWKDKKLIVNRKNQPNCYNDATAPYFKIGLTKWSWGQRYTPGIQKRTYYVDELSIGNGKSSFDKVDPSRSGTGTSLPPPTTVIPPESNAILKYYDFNSGIGQWYERSLPEKWSAFIHNAQSRKGGAALRFELRRHDSKLGYRTELGEEPEKIQEKWYGFSNFFPKDFIKDPLPECVVQFHSHPDSDKGEAWRSPPLALMIINDRFVMDLRTDPNQITRGEPKMTRLDLGPVEKEKWNDWVVHAKWAWDNTGILEIWKNNQLIVSRKNMPNCYNDATYPYFKLGIYKWDWGYRSTPSVQKRVYFADELTIGTASSGYNKVYPGR